MDAIERLKVRTGEADTALLADLLESACCAILARRFPYGAQDELEPRYFDLQIRIALDLYNKQGAEGQTGHTENGVSRQWAAENISKDLLAEVTPMCGGIL